MAGSTWVFSPEQCDRAEEDPAAQSSNASAHRRHTLGALTPRRSHGSDFAHLSRHPFAVNDPKVFPGDERSRLHCAASDGYLEFYLVNDSIMLLHTPGQMAARLGLSLAQAFSSAPDYSFILAGHPAKERALAWFFGNFAARLSLRYGAIHVTEDGSAGILTLAPGKSPSVATLLQAGVLAFPRHFGWLGTWRAFSLGIYMERRRLALAPMPHWYVMAVGVSPEVQGQGLGYDLVTRTLRRAEAEAVPCYLEAFEEKLVEHYIRRGFRVLAKDQLPTGLTLWCLLREPSTVLPNLKPGNTP